MSGAPRPGLFGKTPAQGDFVSRGLDAAERAAWDGFLTEGLERAREALGDAFEPAHACAPAWRFVLAPSATARDGWRAGAVAPSIDRAGRLFALCVLLQGLPPDGARLDAAAEAMEEVIFDSLGAGLDADGVLGLIERAAAALPAAEAPAAPTARWWTLGGFSHAPDTLEADGLDPAVIVTALTPVAAWEAT